MFKNIGVVRWFTDTESHDKNYGFIKFLCGGDDLSPDDKIYFRKSDIVSTVPQWNDCVSFNLKYHWQERNVNCWRVGNVIVLNWNDLPPEIILSRWNELNNDNKRAAFVKCFDDLPADKLADLAKNLPPDEILDAVKDKPTFREKIPAIIERSSKKFSWAQCLVDNAAFFKQINVDDDVMIFFMYEWVKREKPLPELKALLQEKNDAINASLYPKIVYLYICAAHERKIGSGRYSELMNRAQKAVAEIFNRHVEALKNQSQNPAEIIHFDNPEAHVLPPCGNKYKSMMHIKDCSFCEAVVWSQKIHDEDGNYHWENHSWCRRLERADLYCSRLFPHLELSAKDWSLIELTDKLDLRTYEKRLKDHKFNLEIFTRFGGEINRLNELRERIKCRECGKYMRADRDASQWMTVEDIKDLVKHAHFPVLIAKFQCQNDDCPEKGKLVYLSYCWHCGETIDSRDSKGTIAGKGSGYYLCNKCGAGYKDYTDPDRRDFEDIKYAIFPGTICPSCTKCPQCGGQEFKAIPDGEKFKLICTHCANEMHIPSTIKDTTHGGSVYRKGTCTACGHKLEWNRKKLDTFAAKFLPVIWA